MGKIEKRDALSQCWEQTPILQTNDSQATSYPEMNDLVDKNHEISEQACRLINDKLEILNYTKTSQMICVIRDLEIVRQQCGKNVHVVRNGIVCFICFIVAVAIERHRLCTKIYDNVQRRFDLQTFEPLAVYFRMNCVRDLWWILLSLLYNAPDEQQTGHVFTETILWS